MIRYKIGQYPALILLAFLEPNEHGIIPYAGLTWKYSGQNTIMAPIVKRRLAPLLYPRPGSASVLNIYSMRSFCLISRAEALVA